jgi:hypothetical protein
MCDVLFIVDVLLISFSTLSESEKIAEFCSESIFSMISSVSPFASSSAVKVDSTLASVGLTTPHSKNKLAMRDHTNPRTETDSVDKRPKREKMYMRFGIWNVRSIYRAGSLRAVTEEISKCKLDLVRVQEVRLHVTKKPVIQYVSTDQCREY